MSEIDPRELGAALGFFATVLIAVWRVMAGAKKGDGQAPAERAPSQNEVKAAIADLRGIVVELRDMVEEQHDRAKDRHHEIERQLDGIEHQLRLSEAVAAARRDRS